MALWGMDFSELEGKTLVSVEGGMGDDTIILETACGEKYRLYHCQNCCESVWVEDIVGDIDDLIGTPIVVAEEVTNPDYMGRLNSWDESYTWTFYKLRTAKGDVTIRWYGTSNGWYSESVDFVKVG